MGDDKLLKAKDVAHILDCSPDDVYPLIHAGELKAFKVGRLWRFRLEDVMDCKKRRDSQFSAAEPHGRVNSKNHRIPIFPGRKGA